MPTVLVLGCGMVGSVIAADFAQDPGWSVTIADLSEKNLEAGVARSGGPSRARGVRADLSSPEAISGLAREADVVVGALPSQLGFAALGGVIEAGRPYVDISFMEQDPGTLDGRAKARGVAAVVDCGVAPGMSHILAARGAALLDRCETIEIYVGGLPVERRWPFEYKAAFAPADVLEEYTRPSRLVEHGATVVRPALSEPELMDFPGVGTLEAFNTDGLRSLVGSRAAPFMKEKTLRYPGHVALMRAMRETGLFDQTPVTIPDVDGRPVRIRPRTLTAALMFPAWTYAPGEADLTVMRVLARGERGGRAAEVRWDVLDRFDPVTGFTSMSRTTAFPASIVARALHAGRVPSPGVHPPESLGTDAALVADLLREHGARGVRYAFSESEGP